MGKKIFLAPLGCSKNQVDAELMLGDALAAGHSVVAAPEEADVLVVNTCAFIGEAREASVDAILRLARVKEQEAGRRLVVTGCMAQRYAAELKAEIPEIDAMVGTGALASFNEALEARGGVAYLGDKHYLPAATMERVVLDRDGSAYLKVSEGCDHECSFCIIPAIRGRHRSRLLEDVVAEAERLVERGIVEVNLIAQDLSAYGRDQGMRDGLAALLYRLGRVRGLERVRCFYLYPNTLTDAALEAMAQVDNVCSYVDLPLQHADAGVLQAMRRGKDADQLRRLLDRVRSRLPDAVLRTTFIVGFPGETDAAFQTLCDFVAEVAFDRIGVFRFSAEEGSPAADLRGRVPAAVAQQRHDALVAVQEPISAERCARFVGRSLRVLVCGADEAGCWWGRTEGQAPEIDGVTWLGRPSASLAGLRGTCVDAVVTGSEVHDLFAEAAPGLP